MGNVSTAWILNREGYAGAPSIVVAALPPRRTISTMPRDLLIRLCVVVLLAGSASEGQEAAPSHGSVRQASRVGPEAWADPSLKVTRGLALWLDAGRLNAARQAQGRPELREGARVDVWYDGSGHGRHLSQPDSKAQPLFTGQALRFDGETSALERAGEGPRFRDLTLFVVATAFRNPGTFRAFLAMNRQGSNDYVSGLTLDLGPFGSRRLETINVEGSGFGGALNLLVEPSAFGVVRRMTIASTPGRGGTTLSVDGHPARSRDRADSILFADQWVVGARRYNNEGGAPNVRGFLDGDILEILLYDRLLDEKERAEVEAYLARRHGERRTIEPPQRPTVGKPLVSVADPPPVQLFVPGFVARRLPVQTTNINNVKYRADGKLVALAYNGNIQLLSDRDGDGLEETVESFWENHGELVAPIGMALTPPGYPLGDGVFVAGKGKVSLIVDADRDGKADRERIVSQGWKPLPHGVDALGVAMDKDGNIYFGLGAADFTNPYQIDGSGRSHYDLKSERGTILKVSPDFKTRQVVATGIRFPVALAFNREGDLFATDQEGATWLPNGNPFDELLHIQPGRHYGFPPRHPDHLPAVIDEPSVFDYGPQHQSTCGLNFNEPVHGGPVFGPAFWAGDALVTGYSRGKLFRTKLARTEAGYVGQTQWLACLNMLAADACVSPNGELVVAVHSGLPDWGSGPSGDGALYKITYQNREAPQPVLAWASSPQEVRIAFDRPLDPARLKGLVQNVTIEHGQAVRPGDRFESLRPGYEVVARQLDLPRFELPVLSAQVSRDRRTLVLSTALQIEADSYAITIRNPSWTDGPKPLPGALRQEAAIDLGYDLSGVVADWRPLTRDEGQSTWLPHLDLAVARDLTASSAEHDSFWEALKRPGRLTLRTKLDLWRMLRPAVQPGSTVRSTLPDEVVTVTFKANGPIQVQTPDASPRREPGPDGRHVAKVHVHPKANEPVPVEVVLETGESAALEVTYETLDDARPRPLALRRFLLPWAVAAGTSETIERREIAALKGGDWRRGRDLFHGELARCSSCHKVRGRGESIGPDLSNLIHRDYASVYRDIHAPSAAINPDYVAHSIALRDGRVLQGTIRSEGDRLVVSDSTGRQLVIDRSEVETTAASTVSIMPEGLDTALGPEKLRDLLTFLLTEPLTPAPDDREGAPPPRRRSEVDAVLKGVVPVEHPRTLRIVLADGPKDHGPGEHDYPLWKKRWSALLAMAETVVVETADGWPTAEQLDRADVVVLYSNNPAWSAERAKELDRYLARGGGLVLIHYAVDGHEAAEALADRIGLAWKGGASRFRHGPLDLDLSGSSHPIARGFGRLHLEDESYWNLVGNPASVDLIASGVEEGRQQPLLWTRRQGKGRVFVSIPGHYTWTFDDPLFRLLLLRGMAWAAGEPVDRFNELATIGANIRD